MHQAERHGSPLAPVIAAQAAEARLALNRSIVERAARAGPKIQLVVSMTIVPGAMLGMAAAVIAAIARGDLKFL
jgi:tight adherence protein C